MQTLLMVFLLLSYSLNLSGFYFIVSIFTGFLFGNGGVECFPVDGALAVVIEVFLFHDTFCEYTICCFFINVGLVAGCSYLHQWAILCLWGRAIIFIIFPFGWGIWLKLNCTATFVEDCFWCERALWKQRFVQKLTPRPGFVLCIKKIPSRSPLSHFFTFFLYMFFL